jgi:hypothetical protein
MLLPLSSARAAQPVEKVADLEEVRVFPDRRPLHF